MYLCVFYLFNTYLPIHPSIHPPIHPSYRCCFSGEHWLISSVQSVSCVRLFVTPWTPGLPVHHQLPEFTDSYPETVCPGLPSRIRWHIWRCIFLMTTTAVSTSLLLQSSASSADPQMLSDTVPHWHLTRWSRLPGMSPDWPKLVRQAPFTLFLSLYFPLKRLLETIAYLALISRWRVIANKKTFFSHAIFKLWLFP